MEFDGQILKLRRLDAGMTLAELASHGNTSKSYIWELENNRKPSPSVNLIARIANALDLPIEEFLS